MLFLWHLNIKRFCALLFASPLLYDFGRQINHINLFHGVVLPHLIYSYSFAIDMVRLVFNTFSIIVGMPCSKRGSLRKVRQIRMFEVLWKGGSYYKRSWIPMLPPKGSWTWPLHRSLFHRLYRDTPFTNDKNAQTTCNKQLKNMNSGITSGINSGIAGSVFVSAFTPFVNYQFVLLIIGRCCGWFRFFSTSGRWFWPF